MGGSPLPSDGSLADGGQLRAVAPPSDETPYTTATSTGAPTAPPQPVPSTGSPIIPGATPHSAESNATQPPLASAVPTPQQVQNANRSRAARDNLRARQPDGGVQPVTDPSGRRRFTWGRYTTALGSPVSVMRIGIHLTGAANLDPAAVAALLQRAQFAVDLHFNGGFQLPNGDWMMVDLVPVTNPADADMHMPIDSSGMPGTTHPNVDLPGLTARLRDQLGLDPNGGHVSPADLDQLSAAVDRARFTPPPPPWLDNPPAGNPTSEPPRPTTPTPLPNTRHQTAHAVPDNRRQVPPPPRDFRAPESNPPARPTLPTPGPARNTPRPTDTTAPRPAAQSPHNPPSWGAQNPNHLPTFPSGFGSPGSQPDGNRPFDPRGFRAPESLPPPAPPQALPNDSGSSTEPRPRQRSGSTLRRAIRRLFGMRPRRDLEPPQATTAPRQPPSVPPRTADPVVRQQPSPPQEFTDQAYSASPPYETQEMGPTYRGEHEERNSVWEYPLRVAYLNDIERQRLRLYVKDGKLYTADGIPFDTSSGVSAWGGPGRAVFVMDEHGNLYASNYHARGRFHHSSFLAGGNVAAAGELAVIDGVLQLLTDSSGHYRPARGHTMQAINQLRSMGIPISPGQVEFEAPPQ